MLAEALVLLGLDPNAGSDPAAAADAARKSLGQDLPASLVDLLRHPSAMDALAEAYQGDAVFPHECRLVDPAQMPSVDGPVLWLLTENQGVCVWGAPLDGGDEPPVLVGGSLSSGEQTLEFAATVGDFVYAMAWDRKWMQRAPMLQAQAKPLDPATLTALRTRYRETTATYGWPGRHNYRFEGRDIRMSLWSAHDQCDWWLTASTREALEIEAVHLLTLDELGNSLWSNDVDGDLILERLRSQ